MKTINAKLAGLIAGLLAVAAGVPAALAANPDEVLMDQFFHDYLEAGFGMQPMSATQLGDHRFDHLLDDLSAGARARWVEHDRATFERLRKGLSREKMGRSAQIDHDIFEQHLRRSIWLAENTHPFEEDPRVYNDYLNDSVFLLLAQSTLPRETNISNALSRMRQMDKVIQAATNNLRNPPRTWTETAIRQNRGAIAFYEGEIFTLAGKTPQAGELKSAARQVAGWLKGYQEFLEKDLLPRSNGDWRLGREKFSQKLEMVLDSDMTADQVYADAQSEFDRVQREMYVVARQLWSSYFGKKPLPPDDAEGRRATVQAVLAKIAENHSTPQSLVGDARKTVKGIKSFIQAANILTLPEPDLCRIIEMPEFQRGNSTAYMNSPPPLDPKASGFYAVSPPPKDWDANKVRSFFEEYNLSMLQILTIHEAYPGHYVQYEYANRHPSLIRRVLASGVFVEGWAVYTEQMMLDQGYGKGDLALRLTQLKFYLRAVANAMLDHRMHCTDYSPEAALDFLMKDAYQSEGEARLKIIRSQQSSVQLSTYFVGRMAHYRLRQAVQREMGEAFNLAKYHEAVLKNGPVPAKFLPELVRQGLQSP